MSICDPSLPNIDAVRNPSDSDAGDDDGSLISCCSGPGLLPPIDAVRNPADGDVSLVSDCHISASPANTCDATLLSGGGASPVAGGGGDLGMDSRGG